jgi:hypothetical protein
VSFDRVLRQAPANSIYQVKEFGGLGSPHYGEEKMEVYLNRFLKLVSKLLVIKIPAG